MHSNKDMTGLCDLRHRQLRNLISVRSALLRRHKGAHCKRHLFHAWRMFLVRLYDRAPRRLRRTGHLIIYVVGLRVYRCRKNPAGQAVDFGAGAEHFRWGLPKSAPMWRPRFGLGIRIGASPSRYSWRIVTCKTIWRGESLAVSLGRNRLGFTSSLQALALRSTANQSSVLNFGPCPMQVQLQSSKPWERYP